MMPVPPEDTHLRTRHDEAAEPKDTPFRDHADRGRTSPTPCDPR